jgi:hypothetical protein
MSRFDKVVNEGFVPYWTLLAPRKVFKAYKVFLRGESVQFDVPKAIEAAQLSRNRLIGGL